MLTAGDKGALGYRVAPCSGTPMDALEIALLFVAQMGVGGVLGLLLGRVFVSVFNRLRLSYEGLYPVFALAFAVFAYAGFWLGNAATIRIVVAVMGSLFLLLGLLVALAMGIVGFPFGGRGWVVGLAHAALGGLTMACAALLPCDDE